MKRTIWQILLLLLIALLFVGFNSSVYFLFTRRLANNFSSSAQAKMIDVGAYLPHNDSPDLAHIDASLTLVGDLPVLDGAAALVPVYAAIIDSVYPEGSVTYIGGEFSDDNFYGENFAPDSKMQYRNTIRGFNAVVDGTADIFFGAAPSKSQKQYAEEQEAELIYIPVGLEAFVFFVNSSNPIDDLTADQIRGIYTGEYTNWSRLGGVNRPINPITRLEGSGSQSVMNAFMNGRKTAVKSPMSVIGGSIGFSFRWYMDGIVGNESVKMLAVNGIYPSAENIKNGTYPIIAEFYAVYRADNDNPNVRLLVDWLLSDEGQELIEKSGYVGIH